MRSIFSALGYFTLPHSVIGANNWGDVLDISI